MQTYLDAFDVSYLAPELRDKCYHGVVTPALEKLADAQYQVYVSRSLADLKRFWSGYEAEEDLPRSAAFDADFHPEHEHASGLFLATEAGDLVGTVWHRAIKLRDPATLRSLSLKQALEGLFVFYSDPLDAPRRETCTVECEIAEDIKRGTICYGGALWIQKEHRGGGVFKAFSALSRVLSITSPVMWDWFVLLTEDKNRVLALDHFPCTNYTRGVYHPRREIHNWLCTASYQDAVTLALKGAI